MHLPSSVNLCGKFGGSLHLPLRKNHFFPPQQDIIAQPDRTSCLCSAWPALWQYLTDKSKWLENLEAARVTPVLYCSNYLPGMGYFAKLCRRFWHNVSTSMKEEFSVITIKCCCTSNINSYCTVTLISRDTRCWDQITSDLMLCLQNAVSLVGRSTINGVSGWMKHYFCSSFPSAPISPTVNP